MLLSIFISVLVILCAIIALLLVKLKKSKVAGATQVTVDARQLIHDLTNGGAVVRITVIDPTGLMVYRGTK